MPFRKIDEVSKTELTLLIGVTAALSWSLLQFEHPVDLGEVPSKGEETDVEEM